MQLREIKNEAIHWIDIVDPSPEDLKILSEKYNLHIDYIHSCMDPTHLPKYENTDNAKFLILRAYDNEAKQKSDSVQGLTRKLAIYFTDKLLFTVHRKEQKYVHQVFSYWENRLDKATIAQLVTELVAAVVKSYEPEVLEIYQKFEVLESQVFVNERQTKLLSSYLIKRRSSIMNRMLRLTAIAACEAMDDPDQKISLKLVNESIQKLLFQLDEVQSKVLDLVNLQISLASQRTNEASQKTNEVMRMLTIFSVFFMPLNLISSIYGMNFDYMPELKWALGYPYALSLMLTVSTVILTWFYKKGWLKD